MDFKAFARKHFYAEIRENKEINSDLRRKLLKGNHPRIEILLTNTAKELHQAQIGRTQQGKKPFAETYMVWGVREITKVFLHTIELEARKMYETDAEKFKKQQQAQNVSDMDQTLAGKSQGAFEEMGLVIEDKTQTV